MDGKEHWERIYHQTPVEEVSWFQERPEISLKLIHQAHLKLTDPIIDVGGGASRLVEHLLALGYRNLSVVDISGLALSLAQKRLGGFAGTVRWIEGDITRQKPNGKFLFWHDRAVFHFLTQVQDRENYLHIMKQSLLPSAYVLLATFSLEGPEKCSGLPVQRYSPESLQSVLGDEFKQIRQYQEGHRTPKGKLQDFIYVLFQKQS